MALPFIMTFLLPFIVFSSAAATCSRPGPPVVHTTSLVSFLVKLQATARHTYGPKDFDPKIYVDMSLRRDLDATVDAFRRLPRSENDSVPAADLTAFLGEYLNGADADLVEVAPVDFVDQPADFLPVVKSPAVRDWGLEVHALWKDLTRKVSDRVFENRELHTLLPLKNPVVIPGSRFREVYYWDSYWVIRGLLTSKMHDTAKGIVYNLISLIHKYGYVLNGARAYYSNRSQPPLLSSMVVIIYNRTNDKELVAKSLPALLKEHEFWNSGMHKVIVEDSEGLGHSLSRYYAMWDQPRPESSTMDKETASRVLNTCARAQLYRDIASAAESGWDFSTRWMRDESDLATLSTTSIVPVDLNAFILKMELDIVFLANATGDARIAERFKKASEARRRAINSILWNPKKQQWFDYWLSDSDVSKGVYKWNQSSQNEKVFASNFIPLWIQAFYSDMKLVEQVVESLQSSGLIRPAGISTSLTNSGQQWDLPNGWAPLQYMIAEGLRLSGSKKAHTVAQDLVVKWIRTNYMAYKETGAMHEKYDVEKCGSYGGGGEYTPQTGFGWSNGVVLAFLEDFGWPNDLEIQCPDAEEM